MLRLSNEIAYKRVGTIAMKTIKKEPKTIKNRWNENQRVVEYSLELQNETS
jgi:hypothetical protein